MKADPTHQVTLLEIADLDSRAAQLRHQRAHLPEITEIASLTAERTALTDKVRDARIVVDDLTVEQARADREVEQVRTRRERDRNRMDTGQITNPKDLERADPALQRDELVLEAPLSALGCLGGRHRAREMPGHGETDTARLGKDREVHLS